MFMPYGLCNQQDERKRLIIGVKSTANTLDMRLKSNRFQDMIWPESIRHWMDKSLECATFAEGGKAIMALVATRWQVDPFKHSL
jgi:hypothetical protein